jgi:predicted urease superfamily metal-dependent hydrolase
MKAKKVFAKIELETDFIPTPREISAECGFSMKASVENYDYLLELLSTEKVKFDNVYQIKTENGERIYEKIDC